MNNKRTLKVQTSLIWILCFLCTVFFVHSKKQDASLDKKTKHSSTAVYEKNTTHQNQSLRKNLKTPAESHFQNNKKLVQTLQKIIKKSSISKKNLGLAIASVDSPSLDFSVNADHLMIPASLSKIITSSAILSYFHPFHQFQTSFLTEQAISPDGRLKGNLYLKGGGDPSFVSESMWNLVNQLVRTRLKQVEGSLVLDDFLFEKDPHQKRRLFALDRSYNAPISALSFNWNSTHIYVRPGSQPSQPAVVGLDPYNTYLQLKNKTQTKGLKTNIKIRKKQISNGKDLVQVQGRIPFGSKEFSTYRNVSNPLLYTGYNALEFLSQRNILIQGGLKKGRTPDTAQTIAVEKGRSISRLLKDMMKFSNNFIAEMLTIQLSLYQGSKTGSLKKGLQWIHQYLEEKEITTYSFDQPSGLSRKNKLKPHHLLKILIDDFHSPYSYEKISAYPLAGGDGTLKKRFSQLKHPFLIRAKTGRLSGVEGLAGYTVGKKGSMRAFVFIYNGSIRQQSSARKLMDELAIALTQH